MAKVTFEKGDFIELYDDSELNTHLEINSIGDLTGELLEELPNGNWRMKNSNNNIVEIETEKIFKCTNCDKQLCSKFSLNRHLSICKAKIKNRARGGKSFKRA